LEIGNALAKYFKSKAIEVIQALRNGKNIEIFPIDRFLFDQGFEIYQKYRDKNWGLVDCMSFAIMRERGITESLTFDNDFKQAGMIIVGKQH